MRKKTSTPREKEKLEKEVAEASPQLSPIPAAAPPEEPQVDEVLPSDGTDVREKKNPGPP